MKYKLYNSLSRTGHLHINDDMLDVSKLDSQFYNDLTAEDEVYLYGGDGTINNFINNCIIFPKLTVIPTGTGNDFARCLSNDYQAIHVHSVNGVRFINGFGVGFDALVCQLANQLPKKTKLSFISCVYRGLIGAKQQLIDIEVDGQQYQFDKTFLVAVQNGNYFGGGVKIVPNRKVTDQTLSVCVISNGSKPLLATLFPTAFIGLHTKFKKYINIIEGQEIIVRLQAPYIGQCDGEVLQAVSEYQVTVDGTIAVRLGKK